MKKNALISLLNELETAASALQGCLLARDTDGIWENLEQQEQTFGRLNDLQNSASANLQEMISANPDVRCVLRRGVRLVQANRALCQRFLDVVGQTLSRLGGRSGATYAGAGMHRTPVLVCQQG